VVIGAFLKYVYMNGRPLLLKRSWAVVNSSSVYCPGFGEEQADEHVALANRPIVFVLESGLGHRIEEMFPAFDLEIATPVAQTVIQLAHSQLERVAILPQLRR
jgi:hypothetical protein